MPFLLFGPVGPMEILIILLIIVVFFGAKKLPQLGSGLGQGIRNFKESVSGKDEQIEESKNESKP